MEPSSTQSLDRTLGDYDIQMLISAGQLTRTFRAVQLSVNRQVLLDELLPHVVTPEVVADFFADVRAKAAVDHPLIASIYEAVNQPDGTHFFARELLAGRTLVELAEAGERLSPLETARLLNQLADAILYLQTRAINSVPLTPNDVFVEDHGLTRLVNVAIAGERPGDLHVADAQIIAAALKNLLQNDQPGATRMLTLLGWMAGTDRPQPLTWKQILGYAEQIEQQLVAPVPNAVPGPSSSGGPGLGKTWQLAGICALGILAVLMGVLIATQDNGPTPLRDLSARVAVSQGTYPTPDGGRKNLGPFSIGAYEVSIGDYQRFLAQLAALPEAQRNAYDHPAQPPSKADHFPDEWEEMLAAATLGQQWRTRSIDLNYPVVLVDWWDAYAYARWRRGRLPSQDEWLAALNGHKPPPAQLGAVDAASPDVSPNGLYRMAGNVSEWTGEDEINPSVPMAPKRPMIIGASHLRPRDGADAREWVKSRSLRREDVGFRVLYE